jgi:hypothetical protein
VRGEQQRSSGKNLLGQLAGREILIPHAADVRKYLDSHADLGKILPSVCAQARREFGRRAELTLQVYRDPEIKDLHLSLMVRLPSYGEDIMMRLDRVTQPFEERLCSVSGYLLVITDFRPSSLTRPETAATP